MFHIMKNGESVPVNEITHVIFDMDGLLLDTERIYTEVTQEIAQRYGKDYTWEIKVQVMGTAHAVSRIKVIELLDLPMTPEEYDEEAKKLQLEKFKYTNILPGAERLVRHLHAHNIPICVASGSTEYNYDVKISRHRDLFQLFSHTVLSVDPEVVHGKPAPDIFFIAASRFKTPPTAYENVLVFEDSPNGVKAAFAANMPVVMVPDPRVDPAIYSKATQVLKSLEDFQPEQWGLPKY